MIPSRASAAVLLKQPTSADMSARFASAVVLHAGWDLGEIGTLAHPSPRTPKDTKGARGPSLTHLPSRRIPRHGARLAHSRPCAYPPPGQRSIRGPLRLAHPCPCPRWTRATTARPSSARRSASLTHSRCLFVSLSMSRLPSPLSLPPLLSPNSMSKFRKEVRLSLLPSLSPSIPPSIPPSYSRTQSLSVSLSRASACSLSPSLSL